MASMGNLLGGLGGGLAGIGGGLGALGGLLGGTGQALGGQMATTTAQWYSGTSSTTGDDYYQMYDVTSTATTGTSYTTIDYDSSTWEGNGTWTVTTPVQSSEIWVDWVGDRRAERVERQDHEFAEYYREYRDRRRSAAEEMAIAEQAARFGARRLALEQRQAEFAQLNEVAQRLGLNLEGRTLEQRRALVAAAQAQMAARQQQPQNPNVALGYQAGQMQGGDHNVFIGQQPAEAVSKEKEKAEKVAQEMLGNMIGEAELEVYVKTGRLYVKGENADYIVPMSGHIQRIEKNRVLDLCVHLTERYKYPTTDNVIAMKMMIENKEAEVMKLANTHGTRRRKDVIILPAACMERENEDNTHQQDQAVRAA